MKMYIYGVLTLPALWIALAILSILVRTFRDTYRTLRNAKLKAGYGWYNWLWTIPACWCTMLKQQCWSWWNGIETEVL